MREMKAKEGTFLRISGSYEDMRRLQKALSQAMTTSEDGRVETKTARGKEIEVIVHKKGGGDG